MRSGSLILRRQINRPCASLYFTPRWAAKHLATVAPGFSESSRGLGPSSSKAIPPILAQPSDSSFKSVLKQTLPSATPLQILLKQYDSRAGRILDAILPNGSITASKSSEKTSHVDAFVKVFHVFGDDDIQESSGFFIKPTSGPPCLVTCAHTLEQMRHTHPSLRDPPATKPSQSGTYFLPASSTDLIAATEILTCLPRSDLIIYSIEADTLVKALPVSMYPAPVGTPIISRFFGGSEEIVKGKVDGYRDWSGWEAEPGSYDTLSHLIFSPPPTPGASGAPIIDETAGNVVGVVSGSRMYNRVEGLKGWGTPAEAMFELFSLPIGR